VRVDDLGRLEFVRQGYKLLASRAHALPQHELALALMRWDESSVAQPRRERVPSPR
jgi:hypothetical protein